MFKENSSSYKWIVLAISFMLMLTFALSLQSLPPIFDNIANDIDFTNSQAGFLMGIYAIPGIFLPLGIAYLSNKYDNKYLILISLIILILGLVAFSMSNTFQSLLIFRLISGIGATVLVILAPLLITEFFDEANMGIAMGIFNTAVPLGTVISANLFGILGERFSWRSLILGIAVFGGIIFIVTAAGLSRSIQETDIKSDQSDVKLEEASISLSSNRSLFLLAVIWMLANFQLLSYVTFVPQHFQEIGISLQKSGLLTSFVMLLPILLSPFIGVIVDKTGWKKRLILAGSIIMAISFFMISREAPALTIWAMTLGIGFAPIPVLVFSILPDLVDKENMGIGLSLITIASNIGIAGGPAVFGFILDKTGGNFNFGFIALALISFIILLSLSGIDRKGVKAA